MRDVEAVVEELADRDDAGLVVAACWYDVSDDRPHYLMSQFDVQNFLWLTLPQLLREPPADLNPMPDWQAVVKEAAWFFDRLDQPRYAAICRGDRTRKILEAAGDALLGFELYAEATQDSGIMPPPGLRIAWVDDPGPREQALYDAITRALERAIVAGDLDPADDAGRLETAMAVLDAPPDGHTETMLELVLAERLGRLSGAFGSQTVRELLVRVQPDVAKPVPAEPETLFAGCHRLFTVLDTRDGNPRLLGVARDLDLLDEDNRRTDLGDDALSHPTLLFETIINGFTYPDDPVRAHASLPLLAMLLLSDTVDMDMLLDRIGIVFHETGWTDEPRPTDVDMLTAVSGLLADMGTVGLLTDDGERLTDFGRLVALWGIRVRAMEGMAK